MNIDMRIIYQNIEFLVKMILATSMGAIIGFERKSRNKEAGIRTHAIVCLASALMIIVSKYGFFDVDEYDAARVAAQVVSGIGFLGAGLIFIKNNAVNGLTTAAGIWATAGIGLAMGAGLYGVAIGGTFLIVIIQTLMHKDTFLNKDHLTITFEISLEDSFNTIREIRSCLERFRLEIQNVEVIKKSRSVIVRFYTVVPLDFEREHLEDLIFDDDRVKKIEM
ncbi:MAG: MgtC/SapB family protein [Parvimonas sp.]|uniref:MgtC/SapB family protein n=1 Tax=Parvimonas sp. TaxID=1944660 RepID=UPI001CB29C42|nr:MgtC/SapB family protein [Parvimonas sp.]MBF1295433.1 MgtC/SapB family protein [Parvimonas sp.]